MPHDARADARYMRQMRLAEIGERGQARLEAAEVCAHDAIARAYLRHAGVKVVESGEPVAADVAPLGLRHAEARAVGEGALAALVAMQKILEVG